MEHYMPDPIPTLTAMIDRSMTDHYIVWINMAARGKTKKVRGWVVVVGYSRDACLDATGAHYGWLSSRDNTHRTTTFRAPNKRY